MCNKLKMIALLEKRLELDRRNHGKNGHHFHISAMFSGLEKSGRIVALCDWNARFCDQKTLCSRNFAPKTRRPGASLRPDEHSSRPRSENKKVETAFVSNSDERERRESRYSCLC